MIFGDQTVIQQYVMCLAIC